MVHSDENQHDVTINININQYKGRSRNNFIDLGNSQRLIQQNDHEHFQDFYSTNHSCRSNCSRGHNHHENHEHYPHGQGRQRSCHCHHPSCFHFHQSSQQRNGFISKGSCHIPFSFPKRNCLHSEFRLRLAGLTGNLNLHLLKRLGCDVEISLLTGEIISGEMCNIGIDYIEIKKFDQKTLVTILKDTISTIKWLDENCASNEDEHFPCNEQNDCNDQGNGHEQEDGHDHGNDAQHDNFNEQDNDFHHDSLTDNGDNHIHGYFNGQNQHHGQDDNETDTLLNPNNLEEQIYDIQTLIDEHGQIIYLLNHNDHQGKGYHVLGTSQQDDDQEESSSSSSS
jgi:hypothetical protein